MTREKNNHTESAIVFAIHARMSVPGLRWRRWAVTTGPQWLVKNPNRKLALTSIVEVPMPCSPDDFKEVHEQLEILSKDRSNP